MTFDEARSFSFSFSSALSPETTNGFPVSAHGFPQPALFFLPLLLSILLRALLPVPFFSEVSHRIHKKYY